jgi:hypothetical protein
VVLASRDPDPAVRRAAFSALVEGYWKPVYKYLRMKWQADGEEARDLTQSFFTQALEKGTFEHYEPSRARRPSGERLGLLGRRQTGGRSPVLLAAGSVSPRPV